MTLKTEMLDLRARIGALEWMLYQVIFVLHADQAIPPESLNDWVRLAIEAGERKGALRGREHAAVTHYANWVAGMPQAELGRLLDTWRRSSGARRARAKGKATRRGGSTRK